ncbi:hypothetical protein P7D22_03530 [Lichenihabitans sp. Uapishka_5]|uniref:hypothetical protein n=1 Tax=Lichenihabitans sp. Uapishka_5 TaxID=3037302 RepID=UPI0029E7F131|nr:hypothetical protein [Lichenihabitans sp. Uapishka_5]MDX7950249.1 hypothetical protein [Lichenihabitans sp. Uapishka_5]
MEISGVGLLVCAGVWVLGWCLGSPMIIGTIAAVAFGTTSAMTLSAMGGSSPLISSVFVAGLLLTVATSKHLVRGLILAFTCDWIAWAICAFVIYAAVGAIVLPRLFAGVTSAFVTARDSGVAEVALAPNSGNVTQTGYFTLGALACIALLSVLLDRVPLRVVSRGVLVWASINAFGGVIDLIAKTAGAGDLFLPIRTATFAFLTDVEQAGFARINGLYSEASAFAQASMASLAFAFMAWKHGGSRYALFLAVVLLVLLVLSTSSTAYAGLTLLTVPLCASMAWSFVRGRLGMDGLAVILCIAAVSAAVLFIFLYDASILEPFQHLFQTTVLDKSQSESGRERSHWNERSLLSVADTWGLGIGFGSSRASNWAVAVVSQLGFVGTALQLCLMVPFFRIVRKPEPGTAAFEAFVLHEGLRACALTWLLGCIIAGGGADPGILFFIALAGVVACQHTIRQAEARPRFERRQKPYSIAAAAQAGG